MKQYEYIYVVSRKGHFNFCDPTQESISTHIAVMNPDGSKKMYCNISTDIEIDGDYDIVAYIDDYLKRVWSSDHDEIKKFRQYLIDNWDDLTLGNWQQELRRITKNRDKLNERISELEIYLSGRGYFEKGAWVE